MAERKIRLSPTSLQKWFELECPARWDFDWKWKRIGVDEKFLEVGSQVHALMESGPDGWSEYPETQKFYDKMLNIVDHSGLTLVGPKERKFTWELDNGALWSIKIDDFAETQNEELVIVDYKTAWGKGWKMTPSGTVPQSLAFQSAAYLMPPPGRPMEPPDWPYDIPNWPKSIVYLVAPLWGPGQMFWFEWDEALEINLMNAINGAVAAMEKGGFPKVYGKACLDCPFQPKCYGEDGEEALYVPRYPKTNTGINPTPASVSGGEESSGVQGVDHESHAG